MSYDDDSYGDYIDVPERLAEFREKYPNGSLQPADITHPYRVESIGGRSYITYVAAAYRTPDDPRPGIGSAIEIVPGRTEYTRHAELQNAETSAWGRAIVAALAADARRGIATRQEILNRGPFDDADGDDTLLLPESPATVARRELDAVISRKGVSASDADARFQAEGHGPLGLSTDVTAIRALTEHYATYPDVVREDADS